MANHSSASVRETPHVNRTSRTNTIMNALKQRAQAVLNDTSIEAQIAVFESELLADNALEPVTVCDRFPPPAAT